MSDQQNLDAYGKLLHVATLAKGDEKMDPTIQPMNETDRKWLETALQEFAKDTDPVRKLKQMIAQLQQQGDDYEALSNLSDSLIDLGKEFIVST
jgi:hypothetical protein